MSYNTGQEQVSGYHTKLVRTGLTGTIIKPFKGKEVMGMFGEYTGDGSNR